MIPSALCKTNIQRVLYVVAGDLNHVNLHATLPMFHQHVTIATRGDNTLNKVYTNRRETYKAIPHPHLGVTDYIAIQLVSTYWPMLKSRKATQKAITVWPDEAVPMLQDCFQTTDWQMFKEAASEGGDVNLEEYTSSVLDYIRKCVEDVTTSKTIAIPANQKP